MNKKFYLMMSFLAALVCVSCADNDWFGGENAGDRHMTEISIPPEASASQIAALIFLSFTALCLAAYIVVRLLQVF